MLAAIEFGDVASWVAGAIAAISVAVSILTRREQAQQREREDERSREQRRREDQILKEQRDREDRILSEQRAHETRLAELEQKTAEREEKLLQLAFAESEIQSQARIDAALREMEEVAFRIVQYQADNDRADDDVLPKILGSARQRVLNAYDALCQAYLDAKIDGERFRRAHGRNITRVVDSGEYPELEGHKTDYRALIRVYDELRGDP